MFKALIKARLAANYASMVRQGEKKGGKTGKIILSLLLVYAYGAIAFMFGMLFSQLYPAFSAGGVVWLYYAVAWVMALAMGFVLTLFASQTAIYQAKDNDLLLSMPIPPRMILLSRMFDLWLINLMISALVFAPAGFIAVRASGASVALIARIVLGAVSVPFPATALSCLGGYLLSLVTSRAKRKTLVTTIASLLFLGVYFYFYSQVNAYIQELIARTGEVAESFRTGLFPAYYFGLCVSEGGWKAAGITFLCALVPFAVAYALLSATFLRIATAKRGGPRVEYRAREAKERGPLLALTVKELQRFVSSANYMLNAGLGAVFSIALPIVMMVKLDTLNEIAASLSNVSGFLPALAAAAICLSQSMTTLSAASVSLEGKTHWISRAYPVRARDALTAKALCHLTVSLPSALVGSIISCAAFKPEPLMGVMLVLLPAVVSAFFAFLGVTVNVRFPRLDWTNEVTVIKQGASMTVTMLCGMTTMIAMAVLYALLLYKHMSPELYMALWAVAFAALTCVMAINLKTGGARRYEALNS